MVQNLAAEFLQRAKAPFNRHDVGIRDGVAGPGEQIGHSNLRPNGTRQRAQGEIKRARDLLEKRSEQGR